MARRGLKTEARELGVTVMRLRRLLNRLRDSGERIDIPLSEDLRRKVREIIAEEENLDGMITLSELHSMFGTSKGRINHALITCGVKGERRYSREQSRYVAAYERDKAIKALKERYELPEPGYISLTAAAKRIGKNRRELLYWFRSQGIEPREVVINMRRDYFVKLEDWKAYIRSASSSYIPAYLAAELFGTTRTVIELIINKYGGDYKGHSGGTIHVVPDSIKDYMEMLPKRTAKLKDNGGPMSDEEIELVVERARVLVGDEFADLLHQEHERWLAAYKEGVHDGNKGSGLQDSR